jgi:hypothetical protein
MKYIFTTEGHLYPIDYRKLLDEPMKTDKKKQIKTKPSKSCELKMPLKEYYNLRYSLPMNMKYFDQLFELVGLKDNLKSLLERKSS